MSIDRGCAGRRLRTRDRRWPTRTARPRPRPCRSAACRSRAARGTARAGRDRRAAMPPSTGQSSSPNAWRRSAPAASSRATTSRAHLLLTRLEAERVPARRSESSPRAARSTPFVMSMKPPLDDDVALGAAPGDVPRAHVVRRESPDDARRAKRLSVKLAVERAAAADLDGARPAMPNSARIAANSRSLSCQSWLVDVERQLRTSPPIAWPLNCTNVAGVAAQLSVEIERPGVEAVPQLRRQRKPAERLVVIERRFLRGSGVFSVPPGCSPCGSASRRQQCGEATAHPRA